MSTVVDNVLLQGGYILVFGALANGRFATKDILSREGQETSPRRLPPRNRTGVSLTQTTGWL
jgi:hypothetical protein